MCKHFSPSKKAPISYSSCETTYFYAEKISLRAIIIKLKFEGELFFIWARLATIEREAPHRMCISQKV